jgi:hypothetical protein
MWCGWDSDFRGAEMKCKSDLCEQGKKPCPTPYACDYLGYQTAVLDCEAFADTQPAYDPDGDVQRLRGIIWSAVLGIVILFAWGMFV